MLTAVDASPSPTPRPEAVTNRVVLRHLVGGLAGFALGIAPVVLVLVATPWLLDHAGPPTTLGVLIGIGLLQLIVLLPLVVTAAKRRAYGVLIGLVLAMSAGMMVSACYGLVPLSALFRVQ
ncbi:MAG: hypothetical protein U1F29_10610 [Planctomycetota bacterium]